MGGGGSETTKNEPWTAAQPYLKQGYAEAKNLYENFTPEYYGGQTQADFTADQLTSQQGIRDFATKGAPEMMNSAMGAYQYGTGSQVLDVANNPYVQGMAQAAARDAYSGLGQQFSNIRGGSIMSGGFGGGRQGIAEGNALGAANQNAIDATANIYGNAYGQGLTHQANTLGMTGSIMDSGFKPYDALNAVGQQQQDREQSLINDSMAQHEFYQNLPADKLNQYLSQLGQTQGLLGNAGTSTTPGQSGMGQAGEAAQIVATLAPLFTGSDERLKKDISKVGETPSGINLYSWKWKEGAEKFGADMNHTVGVIAQEVMKVIPEAHKQQ